MARLSLPPAAPHPPGLVTALLLLLTSGLACAALPGLPAVPAKAPAAASTPADGAPAAPAVETIPASDIPIRADVDERFAQDVLQRTRGKDPSPKLSAGLDELTRGIVQLSQSFKNDNLRQLSAIRLESLDNHWRFYQRELNEWRAELDATTGLYTDDAAELARRRVTWEATRAALAASGVTAALTDRVDVVIAQIALAEAAISAPLDEQLKLRRRANTVQASIDAGSKGVAAAIAYYDRRLGMVDAAPVWQAWNDTGVRRGRTDRHPDRTCGSKRHSSRNGARRTSRGSMLTSWARWHCCHCCCGWAGAAARPSPRNRPCRRPPRCCAVRSRPGCC